MIKVNNIDVVGFESTIRGMRNPMNSWDKSDSFGCNSCINHHENYDITMSEECGGCCSFNNKWKYNGKNDFMGDNDLGLMQRLYKGGTEHRKYARMINVYMDIEAPLYWWKEFDTYKVGTVANSCSTMHKIHAKEFTLDDFSCEYLTPATIGVLKNTISALNTHREIYNNWKKGDEGWIGDQFVDRKVYWYNMIQLLPTSYNQKRTVMINYETVFNIIRQREHHKLDEWREFVEILKGLPYVKEITNEQSAEES